MPKMTYTAGPENAKVLASIRDELVKIRGEPRVDEILKAILTAVEEITNR